MLNEGALARMPRVGISLVDAVRLAALRHADVRMGQDELRLVAVQGEAMNPATDGVDEERGRAVQDVPGGDLIPAGTEGGALV